MKSEIIGNGTSDIEILNVSPHGFWIWVTGREFFMSFDHFPWFREATIAKLFNVQLLHGDHLFWPELDIDLDVDRIINPENYPLVAR